MRIRIYTILIILLFATSPYTAQNIDSLPGNIDNISGKFLSKILKKYPSIENNQFAQAPQCSLISAIKEINCVLNNIKNPLKIKDQEMFDNMLEYIHLNTVMAGFVIKIED